MKQLTKETISTAKKVSLSGEINTYKVVDDDNDVYFVPIAEGNTDYQAVQEWEAIDGNTIADAD
tara:strand:+ start:187 stop:378 length:192 start_codon:yes stop_codon:yes gene_type:complete